MAGQARPKQTHAHFYTEGGALGAEASRMRPARVPLPWRIYTAAPSVLMSYRARNDYTISESRRHIECVTCGWEEPPQCPTSCSVSLSPADSVPSATIHSLPPTMIGFLDSAG